MATSGVISFIVCILVSVGHAQNTDVRRLNMKINRLDRKTENLEKDVDDIWATIEKQDHVNKTRTDNFDTNAKDVTSMMSGTVTDVQELKTEVEQLVLSSRIGFKNEKRWQREAIRNLTRRYTEFQSGVVEENMELKNHLEDLDTKVTKVEKTNKDSQVGMETINNDFNERTSETGKEFEAQAVINEHVSKMLENLSAKQNRLETENRELKQIITEMQKDYQEKQSNLETLTQKISAMEKDNQELKGGLATLQATALRKPCDEGWESFQHHCYLVVHKIKTWDNASAFCYSKNSYLIELTTDAEFEFAMELIVRGDKVIWIGATYRENEGTFVYTHSELHVPEKYWKRIRPYIYETKHCACMYTWYSYSPKISDYYCRGELLFVCEKHYKAE